MNYSPCKFCHIIITHSEKHGARKGSVPVMPKPVRVKENRSSILETTFMQSYQSPSFLCYVDPRNGREKFCQKTSHKVIFFVISASSGFMTLGRAPRSTNLVTHPPWDILSNFGHAISNYYKLWKGWHLHTLYHNSLVFISIQLRSSLLTLIAICWALTRGKNCENFHQQTASHIVSPRCCPITHSQGLKQLSKRHPTHIIGGMVKNRNQTHQESMAPIFLH